MKDRILGPGDEPIYLLVNPALAEDSEDLGRRIHPVGSTPFDHVSTLDLLSQPNWDDKPLVHGLLKDVGAQFLSQFFGDNVQRGDSLEKLVARGALLSNRIVLATLDATCSGAKGPISGLEVQLSLRIYRVDYDESKYPYSVRAVELLFSDRATGRAPLTRVEVDTVRESFRAASVDALRNRIALSLFGSRRMTDHNWMGEPRADLLGPALTESPQAQPEAQQ